MSENERELMDKVTALKEENRLLKMKIDALKQLEKGWRDAHSALTDSYLALYKAYDETF